MDSNALFLDCDFTNNFASFSGGGFYYSPESISVLRRCEFLNNVTGSDGGAIYYAGDCFAN